MCLRDEPIGPIPTLTALVAQRSFSRGNRWLRVRDLFGTLYQNADFAELFSPRGRPAEAVRARIDWKYALGLELDDAGFDFSLLSSFRARLVSGGAEERLLEALLAVCTAHGLLRARGRQRTDATYVLGVLRVLNRLELVGETLRAALEAIAAVAPAWLEAWLPADWVQRYGRRVEAYRLPKSQGARAAYAATVGQDGFTLLAALAAPGAPARLRTLPAVAVLRQVWQQQYEPSAAPDPGAGPRPAGPVRLREVAALPPASAQRSSPYEPQARYAVKRQQPWVGYKVHLTETCEPDLPHLITQVHTTEATTADLEPLGVIQAQLAQRGLLPSQQLVDAGYLAAQQVLRSQRQYGIELVGPLPADTSAQARAGQGFAQAQFAIDWATQTVRCPRGRPSRTWSQHQAKPGQPPRVTVEFAAADCTPCPVRAVCTRSATGPRKLQLRSPDEQRVLEAGRQQQTSAAFAAAYAARAGIEGTLSQGVRSFGMRQARYRGLPKTQLQEVAAATGLNLDRIVNWVTGRPRATTRRSRVASLSLAS
jgi:transposase